MTKLKLIKDSKQDEDPLLKAAGKLFRQKGFASTTVREIAGAGGMLPGSLHYRYATKESLLLALMEQGITQAINAVRSAIAASRDPIERVRLALRAHLRLLIHEDDTIYVLLYEWRALSGEARETMVRLRDRYDALWDGLLYEAAGTGRLRTEIDLKLVRLSTLGAVNWVAQWYSPGGDLAPDEIADTFANNLLHGILAEDRKE
ncbi:MAG TPA: TetR/AcrR family transcriptional regulator [Blastocatellia bacterium]|jgi:AcrR family transcriptional regulator|nr:TetR/AcrR family transcriptional regulator [Blastocatellia bacterium]